MDCGDCFYSQMVDGILFCNKYCEDVNLEYNKHTQTEYSCTDYVNVENVKEILQYYNNYLKENFTEISNLEEIYDDFLMENKEIL